MSSCSRTLWERFVYGETKGLEAAFVIYSGVFQELAVCAVPDVRCHAGVKSGLVLVIELHVIAFRPLLHDSDNDVAT